MYVCTCSSLHVPVSNVLVLAQWHPWFNACSTHSLQLKWSYQVKQAALADVSKILRNYK